MSESAAKGGDTQIDIYEKGMKDVKRKVKSKKGEMMEGTNMQKE